MIDENIFFREATLRICGSLEIEEALYRLLLYLRTIMPVDGLGFHVHEEDSNALESVAHATLENGAQALSVKTPLPPDLLVDILESHSQTAWVVDSWQEDAIGSLVLRTLDFPKGSGVAMILMVGGKLVGALDASSYSEHQFTHEHARMMSLLHDPLAIALENSMRYREVTKLKELLADDKQYLQGELRKNIGEEIIGADSGLNNVMELVRQVAPLNSPVLLTGETGTGKEVIANGIHKTSQRGRGPFITVNCGAIPGGLMDSELFGHEKGAFTGAISLKRGRFERAHGGTIFLDEIGELPLDAQVRLLRVLQQKEIERVGGSEPVKIDIRVIAATHRDLNTMTRKGEFREDLYFRLNVFPIVIPPLRERLNDIPMLSQYFLRKKSNDMGFRRIPSLSHRAIRQLMSYHWPGNVRELENTVERALILNRDGRIDFNDLDNMQTMEPVKVSVSNQGDSVKLDDVIFRHIQMVLKEAGGKVEGPGGAAERLDVKPSTLRQRMRKLGVPFGRNIRKIS